jgi:hypothetical protein
MFRDIVYQHATGDLESVPLLNFPVRKRQGSGISADIARLFADAMAWA